MSTTRFYRALVLIPGLLTIESILNYNGMQTARAFDSSPAKTSVNETFSNGISILVGYAIINEILNTYDTFAGTGVWKDLTSKQKIAYALLMLLAASGFTYAGVQMLLNNTTTILYGKGLPAVAGAFIAGIANNGATYLAQENQARAELDEPAQATEATRLTLRSHP